MSILNIEIQKMDTKSYSLEDIIRQIIREENERLKNELLKLIDRQETQENTIMDFHAAREFLGFSASHLYKLTSQNLIPHSKRGKKLFFQKEELKSWLLENKVNTIEQIEEEAINNLLIVKKKNHG